MSGVGFASRPGALKGFNVHLIIYLAEYNSHQNLNGAVLEARVPEHFRPVQDCGRLICDSRSARPVFSNLPACSTKKEPHAGIKEYEYLNCQGI